MCIEKNRNYRDEFPHLGLFLPQLHCTISDVEKQAAAF